MSLPMIATAAPALCDPNEDYNELNTPGFRVRTSMGDLLVISQRTDDGFETIEITEAEPPLLSSLYYLSTNCQIEGSSFSLNKESLSNRSGPTPSRSSGPNRLSGDFKKYHRDTGVLVCRTTFKCGMVRQDGTCCDHLVGLFYKHGDPDVDILPDGSCVYQGRPLGWGNTVPAADKRTQRKLGQTWRAHFLTKHGWDQDDTRLPIDCRIKWKASPYSKKYSAYTAAEIETGLGILLNVLEQSQL